MSTAEEITQQIIALMDSKVLLGAALDCMSDRMKAKFEADVTKIINQALETE